jgi:hypothetical protein
LVGGRSGLHDVRAYGSAKEWLTLPPTKREDVYDKRKHEFRNTDSMSATPWEISNTTAERKRTER